MPESDEELVVSTDAATSERQRQLTYESPRMKK